MPLYQYKCDYCGYTEEALLTWAQARDNPFFCPKCKKLMTRLISAFAYYTFKNLAGK